MNIDECVEDEKSTLGMTMKNWHE